MLRLRRLQFSLLTLFVVPLILTPLWVSLSAISKIDKRGSSTPPIGDLWIIPFGFVFALALTLASYYLRRKKKRDGARSFWWFLFHGVASTMLCYGLLFAPILVVMAIRNGQVFEMVGDFAQILGVLCPIGGAAGGILGLCLGADQKRVLPVPSNMAPN
jgi:uncharacterized membrane protein YhaH (DUF805 family)